jgi:quinol-cytochrome oxidoreductase complex cytochrome b subunit
VHRPEPKIEEEVENKLCFVDFVIAFVFFFYLFSTFFCFNPLSPVAKTELWVSPTPSPEMETGPFYEILHSLETGRCVVSWVIKGYDFILLGSEIVPNL